MEIKEPLFLYSFFILFNILQMYFPGRSEKPPFRIGHEAWEIPPTEGKIV
jgi:hypothetical protein